MQDRVSRNPGRVLITPEDGSTPFYAIMTRADNPEVEGTKINKNALLKDATAALFGLGTDAVPDDIYLAVKDTLDAFGVSVGAALKAEIGTYTGTGTTTKSITFTNTPKVVFIACTSTYSGSEYTAAPYVWGATSFGTHGYNSNYMSILDVTISGNTMTWTGGGNSGLALNWSSDKYKYVAIY